MARSKTEAHRVDSASSKGARIARDEILADGFDDYADQFDIELDDETDFDVDDDFAFLGEEYDVLDLDDVLDMCNLERRNPYRN